jgi:hypothetical protein
MTATVSYMPRLEDRPSHPSLRAWQALTGSTPDLLDSTWWPRSLDFGAGPPSLTAVLDPQTVPVSAAWLMAAVSAPLRMSSTGRLMEEAARLRTVSGSDRAVQAVWDAEGGHEARGPTSRPRIPAVALPSTNPALGM